MTMTSTRTPVLVLTVLAAALVTAAPRAQERFSFFQASTPESVEHMLKLAGLRDDDVVVDLGSGDGLIPLMAAKMNPKLRGWGVDINPDLVTRSNARAKAEGVVDRVKFYHQNAFDADLKDATVITMWLFPELMYLLRPIILERAQPGARVLTTTWTLGTWHPDETSTQDPKAFKWIVPARVGGAWQWTLSIKGKRYNYSALLEQQFQVVEGVVRADDRREVLTDPKLRGADLSFGIEITLDGLGLTKHEFTGRVDGNQIRGTLSLTPADQPAISLPWRATRASRSGYFAHTGTAMFQPPGK